MSRGAQEKLAYRVSEACQAVGLSRSRLYELIAEGRIRPKKLGTMTLIPADQLRDFIASLPDAA